MGRFHLLFLFFVSVMFAISLVSLFGYHIYLVLLNRTTLGTNFTYIPNRYLIKHNPSVFPLTLLVIFITISEAFRAPIFRFGGPDTNGYNLGKLANFKEVFGDNWHYWFIPVYSR